jgi:hypothetical protein
MTAINLKAKNERPQRHLLDKYFPAQACRNTRIREKVAQLMSAKVFPLRIASTESPWPTRKGIVIGKVNPFQVEVVRSGVVTLSAKARLDIIDEVLIEKRQHVFRSQALMRTVYSKSRRR